MTTIMQKSKYFYNGIPLWIPLAKYCKDNNININTIKTRNMEEETK